MTPGRGHLRAWLDLGRAANLPSVWSNTLAALVLAGGAWPTVSSWTLTMVLASAAYLGGAMLNDVIDVEFDRRHRPERPIPSGRVSAAGAAVAAAAALALSGAGFVLLAGSSVTWAALMVAVIAAYDWLHKRWLGAIALMAACRATLGLTVASTVAAALPSPVWWWAAALSMYIVVLSLIARAEYRSSAVREATLRAWVGRLLALMPCIDAAALGALGLWPQAWACAMAIPAGRAAQRLWAAT